MEGDFMFSTAKKHSYIVIFFTLLFICNMVFFINIQKVNASPEDTPNVDVQSNQFINLDNGKIRDELLEMLKDDTNKQQLQVYINSTRPVIEKYKSRFESATNASLWAEENIPIAGHLISNTIMSITNYFYQSELKDLANTPVAQKFEQLRSASINLDLNLFQQAVGQYVINNGVDFSMMMNLQDLINEKSESIDFIRTVIKSSGMDYIPTDIGTVLPKL